MTQHNNHPARPLSQLPKAILIGTPDSVKGLIAMLGSLDDSPRIGGALIVGNSRPKEVSGIAVLGPIAILSQVQAAVAFDLAIMSLPKDLAPQAEKIASELAFLRLPLQTAPPIAEIFAAQYQPTSSLTPNPAQDFSALLGRSPHPIDRHEVAANLTGRRVLITGAGGSIGSELARTAASFEPAEITLMERSENALFEIDRQLARAYPSLPRRTILHDIVDAQGTLRLLEQVKPHAVYHAAAHKHVPLMEDHPRHAVINNLFGTKSIADASIAVGAERFVLISSDKAVNPSSVMGATKRLAELYLQGLASQSSSNHTRLSMVRFGNVLGSAGSVIPIWSAQLNEGGPITVTDPRMTRFFMTIPEAAALVIQASVIQQQPGSAALYELDMGQPVPIVEMARRFCREHGFSPRFPGEPTQSDPSLTPIDLIFTGTRPGEKIHEELAYLAEQVQETGRPGIRSWVGNPSEKHSSSHNLDIGRMTQQLAQACDNTDHEPNPDTVIQTIAHWVPQLQRQTPKTIPSTSPITQSTPSNRPARSTHSIPHQQIEPRTQKQSDTTAA